MKTSAINMSPNINLDSLGSKKEISASDAESFFDSFVAAVGESAEITQETENNQNTSDELSAVLSFVNQLINLIKADKSPNEAKDLSQVSKFIDFIESNISKFSQKELNELSAKLVNIIKKLDFDVKSPEIEALIEKIKIPDLKLKIKKALDEKISENKINNQVEDKNSEIIINQPRAKKTMTNDNIKQNDNNNNYQNSSNIDQQSKIIETNINKLTDKPRNETNTIDEIVNKINKINELPKEIQSLIETEYTKGNKTIKLELKNNSNTDEKANIVTLSNSDINTIFESMQNNDNFSQTDKNNTNGEKFFTNFSAVIKKNSFEFKLIGEADKNTYYHTFTNTRIENIGKTTGGIIKNMPDNSSSTAKLILKPASLGTVFVEISLKNNTAKVSFKAESTEAVVAIENQIGNLKEQLSKSSINIDTIDVKKMNYQNEESISENTNNNKGNEQEDRKTKKEFLNSFSQLATLSDKTKEPVENSKRIYTGKLIEKYV